MTEQVGYIAIATLLSVEGDFTNLEGKWHFLIFWPEVGIVVPWPVEMTAVQAMGVWLEGTDKNLEPPYFGVPIPTSMARVLITSEGVPGWDERPDADEVYVIRFDAAGVVIPWLEGMTQRESVEAWQRER